MARRIGAAALGLVLGVVLAACSPRFDWREIRQPGFVAVLPGKAQIVVRQVAIEQPPVRAEMTMVSSGIAASLFAVGSVQLPASAIETPEALAATVDSFRAGLLRNAQAATAVEEEAGAPAGLGTRRLRAAQAFSAYGRAGRGKPARLAVRLYVVDDHLFQLVALGAEGEIPPAALEIFFDSFRLSP
jgi:hypothetical protein